MDAFRKIVAERIAEHLDAPADRIESMLAKPRKAEWGDFALPCHPFGGKQAAELAARLAKEIPATPPIAEVSAVQAFLNIRLSDSSVVEHVLGEIHRQADRYGTSDVGAGGTIVVDYSSPNIAKPFHVGHLRTTIIGASLCRIFEARGYKVVRMNHLGDWGTQFGLTQAAFEQWGSDQELEQGGVNYLVDLYVRANEEADRDPAFRERARATFKALEDGDETARAFWAKTREISLRDFQRVYDLMGIRFDEFKGEAFYNDKMDDAIRRVEQAGIAEINDGALVVYVEGKGKRGNRDIPAMLLRKSDGATTYHTRDLAAALYRKKEYDFRKNVYVVGGEQTQHFKQLFKLIEMMGLDWAADCVHVPFGRIHGMSTRSGGAIRLDELFERAIDGAMAIVREQDPELSDDEARELAEPVGIGAVMFFDLARRRTRNADFDWDRILQPIGDTGPYVQYTHARLCSILRKWNGALTGGEDIALLRSEHEVGLAKVLAGYPKAVERAEAEYEPSHIATYLLDLGEKANGFHHNCNVIRAEPKLAAARALLVDCTRRVLALGLNLLGIAAPQRM